MTLPTFRSSAYTDVAKTVKDICDYLPSMQLIPDESVQLTHYSNGVKIHANVVEHAAATPAPVNIEPEDFFSSYNQCDIYNSYGKTGEKRTSQYESANSGVFLEINKYTVNLNGIYANLDRKSFRVTDVAKDFFTLYPTLSATDSSALYGSLRLNFHLTSGTPSPSSTTVFDFPPIYYTWDLSAEYDFEKCSHFKMPGNSDYSFEYQSKGNYDQLTETGMPAEVNCIVGLFKFDNLKSFSDIWHATSGALSGNPKLDAYCKTIDYNPTIFMSFTDELLNYVHTANAEEPHES